MTQKQIQIGYSERRTYNLTPTRRKIGKALARGSRFSIANQCLNDQEVSGHIFKKVCKMIQSEVEELCSDRVDSTFKHR